MSSLRPSSASDDARFSEREGEAPAEPEEPPPKLGSAGSLAPALGHFLFNGDAKRRHSTAQDDNKTVHQMGIFGGGAGPAPPIGPAARPTFF